MKTMAFIQARMGSTRLPGKVLLDLAGKPVLQHVVERVQASETVDETVVVTTFEHQDLPVVAWCADHAIRVFSGSENDVLDRFFQAARLVSPDILLRITADCPLMDPLVIDQVVRFFKEKDADYVNNTEHETYPDGLDVEVFRFETLKKAWNEAQLVSEREHVTPYIRKHPELFKLAVLDHEPSLKGMRWTLDQDEDYAFIRTVYEELGSRDFGMREVIELLAARPDLQTINGSIVRNEGYLKSIHRDRSIGPRS